MPLSGELQAIVDRLNRDNARYAEQARRAHQEAYALAGALAARLGAADPTVRRVILFGSALPGRPAHSSSG